MPSNIEIKAKLPDKEYARKIAREASQQHGEIINQEDTFYNATNGRLKLRVIKGSKTAQLISYSRQDLTGPKKSVFSVALIESPNELNGVLTESLGVLGKVKKTRLLFMVGQTRVHIDSVEGLGDFIELEVVLHDGQSPSEGEEIAQNLMKQLKIMPDDLIACAYMDLILAQDKNT